MSTNINAPPFWETNGGPHTRWIKAYERAEHVEELLNRLRRLVSKASTAHSTADARLYRKRRAAVEDELRSLGAQVPHYKSYERSENDDGDVSE